MWARRWSGQVPVLQPWPRTGALARPGTWWIRRAITRAIADQARTIRIPVHMLETINKVMRTIQALVQEHGREPRPEEVARRMELPVSRVFAVTRERIRQVETRALRKLRHPGRSRKLKPFLLGSQI